MIRTKIFCKRVKGQVAKLRGCQASHKMNQHTFLFSIIFFFLSPISDYVTAAELQNRKQDQGKATCSMAPKRGVIKRSILNKGSQPFSRLKLKLAYKLALYKGKQWDLHTQNLIK